MKRDPQAFLYDIIETADAVAMAVAALTLEDDKASRLIRSSVEHEFILICEALSKLSRVDPALFASIDQGPRIISFRNQLTHEYHNIDHVLIWGVIVGSLPGLREQCGGLHLPSRLLVRISVPTAAGLERWTVLKQPI